LSTGPHFALDYSYLKSSASETGDVATDDNNSGAYILFSQFNKDEQKNLQVYEKWSLNEFRVDNFFDVSIAHDLFLMRSIDINTIHLYGHMSYTHNKTWAYENIDPESYTIEWDFRVRRVHGWFGQALEESILADGGVIGWNTYGYVSELADDHGYIRISGKEDHKLYKLGRSDYQLYADMNYGSSFPSSSSPVPVPEDIEYPWTWMHVYHQHQDLIVDKESSTTTTTVSIVAGIGRQDNVGGGIDKNKADCGASDGAYINVWINTTAVGASKTKSLGYSQILACNKTITLLKQSDDGSSFTIEQKLSNWQHLTDKFGTHLIPLEHALSIQSPNYSITIICYATTDDYLRFLFPLSTFVFSDFEAIGVPCHVVIGEKKKETDVLTLTDFWSTSTGIEFGYRAKIHF
jgi:hypothetical protein